MAIEGPVAGAVVVRGVTERVDTEGDSEIRKVVVKTLRLESSNLNSVADSVVDVVLLLDSKCSWRCFFSIFHFNHPSLP